MSQLRVTPCDPRALGARPPLHRRYTAVTPLQALGRWGELRSYSGAPVHGRLSGSKAQKHLQGYFAAVTFADYQVGRVLTQFGGGGATSAQWVHSNA